MFTEKNLSQIREKGIHIDTIERQLKYFSNGFPPINLTDAATINNRGIIKVDSKVDHLCKVFDDSIKSRNIIKFVPASGAASRMFKSLFSFREKYKGSENDIKTFKADKGFNSVNYFISNIKKFAFYVDLKNVMSNASIVIDDCVNNNDINTVIDFLLLQEGLNYASLPKGLLKFHSYDKGPRTAFEEHFVEAATYAKDSKGNAFAHFTISPEHKVKFKELLSRVIKDYEKDFNVKFNISNSVQKPGTDTIAVDMNNQPYYESDGSLLFRPGGHGALLENLNDLKGDIIFIKNIDNIVPDRLKEETYKYKKVLAGLLIDLQQQSWNYLNLLEKGNVTEDMLSEMISFAVSSLNIQDDAFISGSSDSKIEKLKLKLNRPMRICGMVKNEGEPGGGPFWTMNKRGERSLQIVESSQIDLNDDDQKKIFERSTHFNPVDLVCGVKDNKGKSFDLMKYIDPDTGFISVKSKDGRDLKALELPGLWNGAMADWITIFVEVPIITFNPVKTVNDLLREEHQ
jgi:hypothetical protein